MAGSRVVGRSAPLTVAARGDAPAPCPCAGVSPCGAGPAWASVLGGRALQHTQTDVGCPPGPRLRLAGALLPWPPSACEGPRTGSHQLTAGPLPEAVWPLLLPLAEPASGASAPAPPRPLMASSRRAMRHLSGLASGALAYTHPPHTRPSRPHPRHTHTPYTLHTHTWTHTPSPHAHAFARWWVLSSAFWAFCPTARTSGGRVGSAGLPLPTHVLPAPLRSGVPCLGRRPGDRAPVGGLWGLLDVAPSQRCWVCGVLVLPPQSARGWRAWCQPRADGSSWLQGQDLALWAAAQALGPERASAALSSVSDRQPLGPGRWGLG